ncbi:MAG: esterase-like activity of phytase family protein [Tateyamaria sp.]|uniref:esterase-like activity of phytase family protein n=1 Tax=Tateyamaria sp. TaxID=1929288 RepID=UPI003288B647
MRWRLSVALILSASASLADPLTFLRTIPLDGLGGVSAIEVEQDGQAAFVLSDRGTGHRFTIERTKDGGRIIDIASVKLPYPAWDIEGLAISDNSTFLSYEDPASISTLDGEVLHSPREFYALPSNGALEALAITPDGALLTLPENPHKRSGTFPIYRYRDEIWDIAAYLPRIGGFQPTGADVGPDGQLYVLERAFSALGFRTRIRRVTLDVPEPTEETILETRLGTHDNLEGLSVWTSRSGATCLSMVSDDNFLSVQTSELVEYALTETLAGGATCD